MMKISKLLLLFFSPLFFTIFYFSNALEWRETGIKMESRKDGLSSELFLTLACGKVTSSCVGNFPLSGVLVFNKRNPNNGTYTDNDGLYCISPIYEGDTLVFALPAYKLKAIKITGVIDCSPSTCKHTVDVVLECDI